MFSKYDWILFDLDNTLLDFSETSKLAFKDLMQHFELGDSEENYAIYGPINAKYWHYFEKRKITADELKVGRFDAFLKAINSTVSSEEMATKYLEFLIHHSFCLPGTIELLQELSKTHQLAIITNGLKDAQHARLDKHKLKPYFQHIFISEEMGTSKPHESFFTHVHETIQAPPKHKVLVIGDNPNSDIKGGRNFNYDTCWYNYRKDFKQHVKATHKITSWDLK